MAAHVTRQNGGPRWSRWAVKIRRPAIVVATLFLITAAVKFVDFANVVKTVTDYLEYTQSPALKLAENTAKSDFSDRLTRMAWRRLYWARLFAQRVVDEAPLQEIESAWSTYINAAADWNAELMIFIVGLEQYYSVNKSEYFENTIQIAFAALDEALRAVRRSEVMRKIRSSQPMNEEDQRKSRDLFEAVLSRYGQLNAVLYDFSRCFERGNRSKNKCEAEGRDKSAAR